jgi:ABC-type hemin transport system ATPase subunit
MSASTTEMHPGTEKFAGTEPIMNASGLVAGYLPGVNILNGCDLVCYPGELIGIIGPNGAGKSTLLKASRSTRAASRSAARTSRTSRPTSSCRPASASCRRRTTSSRR